MSFLAWIVLGLVAGFIGSKIVNKTGEGILLDIELLVRWSEDGFSIPSARLA
jgi:uncharacterized membrane protein YeaQ/YmgE (transglycosylase-associated protein family)